MDPNLRKMLRFISKCFVTSPFYRYYEGKGKKLPNADKKMKKMSNYKKNYIRHERNK